ncbi:MFS transporter [Catelliglobosispora koreensis]|uniref:MFS transporter n=1 Tax=Catelliglobosispora koreensis TaxID=129052 RepID=UPI0012F75BAD|nr:MFS transporter [Catelliglobosispora koreensis]
MTRQPWPLGSLLLLCAGIFLSVTTELVPTGLLLSMSRDLSVSPAQIGLLVTGYAVMVALFAAPLGTLTARLPRRLLLTAALASYAVSNAVMIFAETYSIAVVARLIGGLTHGLFWAVLGGYAARLVSPERVGRAITIVSSGGAAAVLIGVPAGTSIGVAVGWRYTFAGLAVLGVVLALLAQRLPEVPGSTAAVRTSLLEVVRLPGFPAIVATTAVTMLGAFTFSTYTAPLLANAGLSEAQIAPVLMCSGLAGTLMLPVTGWLVDRWLRQGMLTGAALMTGALVLLSIGGRSAIVAIAAVTMSGLAMGLLPVLFQTATLRTAPDHTEQASGVNASAFNVGIAGGATIGALTLDHVGIEAVPVVGAVLAATGLIVYLTAGRTKQPALGLGRAAGG